MVFLFSPMKTRAREEEMLMGKKNMFFELFSPSFFKKYKAKVPFASDGVSMMVSPRALAMSWSEQSSSLFIS